jgi:hypothetical protein
MTQKPGFLPKNHPSPCKSSRSEAYFARAMSTNLVSFHNLSSLAQIPQKPTDQVDASGQMGYHGAARASLMSSFLIARPFGQGRTAAPARQPVEFHTQPQPGQLQRVAFL